MHFALSTLIFATSALAHMQIVYPPPFGAINNPHRTDPADERLQFPYNCCGRKNPSYCRGYLKQLGTPQGAPVASWAAGSKQNFNLSGIGDHYGGSCQVGFSVDKGQTWQVTTSWEGNCPHRNGGQNTVLQNFDFNIPADMPTGDVVFGWTWFNREQEFNMNCASVSITAGSGKPATTAAEAQTPHGGNFTARNSLRYSKALQDRAAAPATVPYMSRPAFLLADIGNGCTTTRGSAEVKYPNPGPDVVQGDGEYPLALPQPADVCNVAPGLTALGDEIRTAL